MGISSDEINKAIELSRAELYERIRLYYDHFIEEWMNLSTVHKSKYIFGNGRTCRIELVDSSYGYIKSLTTRPSKAMMKDLALSVTNGSLEYAFHNEDEYSIKMGAYAHCLQ